MSKVDQLESSPFEQFQTHQQIPILSILIPQKPREKLGDFPDNIRHGLTSIVCVNAKMASLSHARKILSEYLNNRNSLMRKWAILKVGRFSRFTH